MTELEKFTEALHLRDGENDFDPKGVIALYKAALKERDDAMGDAISYGLTVITELSRKVDAERAIFKNFVDQIRDNVGFWVTDGDRDDGGWEYMKDIQATLAEYENKMLPP